jgi:hypothetical protein
MERSAWRRWAQRLELFALGEADRRGASGSALDPSSPGVIFLGGVLIAVALYVIGAVALVQGGGAAAITVGILEIAVARGVQVPSRARLFALITFAGGVLTVVSGIGIVAF